jgi:hypothetical protein
MTTTPSHDHLSVPGATVSPMPSTIPQPDVPLPAGADEVFPWEDASRPMPFAAICARADRQHAAMLAGDKLIGVDGDYPPAHL